MPVIAALFSLLKNVCLGVDSAALVDFTSSLPPRSTVTAGESALGLGAMGVASDAAGSHAASPVSGAVGTYTVRLSGDHCASSPVHSFALMRTDAALRTRSVVTSNSQSCGGPSLSE